MPEAATALPKHLNAALVFADGQAFFGKGVGKPGTITGEICFNTAMTGYQEILTDPSYSGQIITFTFPHIGNVGVNKEDIESKRPFASGLIMREDITSPSNFRAVQHFNDWLQTLGLTGICGVDTRAITRKIRQRGAQNVAIGFSGEDGVLPDVKLLHEKAKATPSLEGRELAEPASTKEIYSWQQSRWRLGSGYGARAGGVYKVVAVDYGVKYNILRNLVEVGCDVTVVPATTKAEVILAMQPDGIFLSNGPGDPAATGVYALPEIKKLIASGLPIFGICLGHQLLGLAVGAKTEKMFQGHRGANHPVKNLETGQVEITSQNHGFAVAIDSLPSHVKATHVSLFDGTLQGLRLLDKPVFSVQYHPESSPGPHDSRYLFEQFVASMQATQLEQRSKLKQRV